MIEAELADGTILEFPDGTDPAVIQEAVKQRLGVTDQPSEPAESQSLARGAVESALQGATFGFSDEIEGAIAGALATDAEATVSRLRELIGTQPPIAVPSATFEENRDQATAELRAEQEQFAKENPATAIGSTIAGGVLTAGPALASAKALGVPVTGVKGVAATGGAMGAAGGAGVANEGEALQGAASGALVGALGGTLLSYGARGVQAAWRKLAPDTKTVISNLIDNSGLTPAQVATRLSALGPKATIADTADIFKRTADVAASRLGPTSKKVQQLIRRDETQFSRLMEPIKRTLGGSGEAAQTVNQLKDIRMQQAGPLYESAFNRGVGITDRMRHLLTLPETRRAWASAQRIGRSDPDLDPSMLADGADPSFRGWQAITENLWDRISFLERAGKFKAAGTIKNLRNSILRELDDQSPDYAKARALWAGTKQADDMIEAGGKFLKTSPEDIAEQVSRMSDADKAFYRMGVGRAIEQRMATANDTTDLGRMFRNEGFRRKVFSAFPDKESAVDFINTVKAEAIKKSTANAVGKGSQTQPRQVAERQLTGGQIGTQEFSKESMANKALSLVSGPRENTIQELGDLLLSQDPAKQQQALQMMIQAVRKDPARIGATGAGAANLAGQGTGL